MNHETIEERDLRRLYWNSVFRGIIAVALVLGIATSAGPDNWPRFRGVIQIAFSAFLCCAAGYWLGLGVSKIRWPICILLPLAAGILIGWSQQVPSGNKYAYLLLFPAITCLAFAASSIIQSFFGHLAVLNTPPVKRQPKHQFGITHLIIWMTVSAIVVAMLQIFGEQIRLEGLVVALAIGTYLALTATLLLCLLLQSPTDVLKTATAVFGVLLLITISASQIPVWSKVAFAEWGIIGVLNLAMIGLSALCLRKQDIRFAGSKRAIQLD